MKESAVQKTISLITTNLQTVPGIVAILLTGSRSTVNWYSDSDLDFYLLYEKKKPLSMQALKTKLDEIDQYHSSLVTQIGAWGQLTNGGGWANINNIRCDFFYREIEQINIIIAQIKKGFIFSDISKKLPFGFHNYDYAGQIKEARILYDSKKIIVKMKNKLNHYPIKLKKAISSRSIFQTRFMLQQAYKFEGRSDIFLLSGSLSRMVSELIQVLYAINEVYTSSDKRFSHDFNTFRVKPDNFIARINKMLGTVGTTKNEFKKTMETALTLYNDVYKLLKMQSNVH